MPLIVLLLLRSTAKVEYKLISNLLHGKSNLLLKHPKHLAYTCYSQAGSFVVVIRLAMIRSSLRPDYSYVHMHIFKFLDSKKGYYNDSILYA
jgi:hypothetical protein